MSQTRLIIGLAVAIVVGLLVASYVYKQLRSAREAKPVAMAQVVVAAARIPLGQRLGASQLREIPWPLGQQPAGSFVHISDCSDRVVIGPLVENEPILEENLAPKEGGAGLAAAIPEGMRAISVHVDDVVAVAGFVVPGSVVDVLATGATVAGDIVTRTILQGLRVLAAGQKVDQDREGKPQTYTVVTLLVTPDEADKLSMASTEGKIHLVLRNSMDMKQGNPPPVSRGSLFMGGPPPTTGAPKAQHASRPPAPKSPEVYLIEVIRGDKRENQSFPAPQAHP
jgi:pilus assembly protein CpaB